MDKIYMLTLKNSGGLILYGVSLFVQIPERNQTLKTGTPHENNPVAEKPHPYGAKRNALRSDTVTTAVKAQIKSTLDQQIDAAVDTALVDLSG
ncbi:hypothetical protein FQA97_23420, partial [Salmonella enterica]|nr:hypothetical protein [Salmonella enterica]EDN6264291.1 hypothetical protein [Salmonella enterica]